MEGQQESVKMEEQQESVKMEEQQEHAKAEEQQGEIVHVGALAETSLSQV
jgi:hypothetical protein